MDYIIVLYLFILMLKSNVSDLASGTISSELHIVVACPLSYAELP